MLVCTDPFRELDRLTQHVLGAAARPAAMPMDAYRKGDSFYVHFDLPGVSADSIDLTVEQNVLTVRAQRKPEQPDGAEMLVAERARWGVHPAGAPRRHPGRRQHLCRPQRRRADPGHPGARAGQAPHDPDHRARGPQEGHCRVAAGRRAEGCQRPAGRSLRCPEPGCKPSSPARPPAGRRPPGRPGSTAAALGAVVRRLGQRPGLAVGFSGVSRSARDGCG
jgi:hypothetical protein